LHNKAPGRSLGLLLCKRARHFFFFVWI